MSRIWQSILLLWLALCVCAPAFALGLGQIQVRSQAGEPLLAEIPVVSSDPSELQQLRRDNKRLQEENEILRKASAFFARWAEKA